MSRRSGRGGAWALACRILAWTLLAALVAFTLAPIGYRPATAAPASVERFCAFAALALLFALGHPRRRWRVLVLTIAAAAALEAMQALSPSRHGRALDFAVKAAGCGLGTALALALSAVGRLRPRPDRPG